MVTLPPRLPSPYSFHHVVTPPLDYLPPTPTTTSTRTNLSCVKQASPGIVLQFMTCTCGLFFISTKSNLFTLGLDGSFAIAAAAPCCPASKTATAEMPANGLGGNVLLWAPSHIRCFPRAAGHRVVSCRSTLGGRAHHHLVCITGKAGTRADVERESLRQKPQVPATRHGFCRMPQRQKPDGKNRSHSALCPFGIVSVRHCVRSALCPFGIVSVRHLGFGFPSFGKSAFGILSAHPLGIYNECHEVYRDIIRTTSDDFDVERETNMTAVAVNRAVEVELPYLYHENKVFKVKDHLDVRGTQTLAAATTNLQHLLHYMAHYSHTPRNIKTSLLPCPPQTCLLRHIHTQITTVPSSHSRKTHLSPLHPPIPLLRILIPGINPLARLSRGGYSSSPRETFGPPLPVRDATQAHTFNLFQ
ncbi:hypothetical protein GWK47_034002 [Chionoecetes opilio]|uniref:Uncharacterized protein n=1 Tax=Chionoecetes opilio TaxID=41210 RepID=A0A8J5D037_CHIOP|nr:hypothetical protein GWK47_034002 [Chionoecetes opilio]